MSPTCPFCGAPVVSQEVNEAGDYEYDDTEVQELRQQLESANLLIEQDLWNRG